MKIIYTSLLGYPRTINNQLICEKLHDANGFVDLLRINLNDMNKLLIISNRWDSVTPKGQSKDEVFNDYHYTNEEFAKVVHECYKLSGIGFKEVVMVDNNYSGDLNKDIHSADMILVQGGHTPRGLKILKELKFDHLIEDYNGVVLMPSTSSKLLASKVLSTHHGSINEYEIEEGLNLKKYSVRPHFEYSLADIFKKKVRNRIKLIKDFSEEIDVYAIGNDSYIMDDGSSIVVYGNCYLCKDKKFKKICKDNNYKLINYDND